MDTRRQQEGLSYITSSTRNATCNRAAIDNIDDRHQELRPPIAADDQRELPNDVCPQLFGHDNRYHYTRAVLPPARPETDKKECRYSSDRHDIGMQSHVIVPSTWLTMSSPKSSDIQEKCRAFHQEYCPANYNPANVQPEEHSTLKTESTYLPPGVVRQRQR